MLQKNDEYLHEYKKSSDWVESYNINIVDKKNSIFGFADVDYLFNKKKVEYNWTLIVGDKIFKSNNLSAFDGKLDGKKVADKNLEYTISTPKDAFQLVLKDETVQANLKLAGIFPVYVFPTSIPESDTEIETNDIELWNRYAQRCKITGSIALKNGSSNKKKIRIDCFGQREHQWGKRLMDKITSNSRLSIQFRDMSMNLTYVEVDGITFSSGVISRKSGNIPIQNVDCELVSFDKKNNALNSSEFSYTDAQDEVDLVVSKKIHSIQMHLPRNKMKKYIRFRNFSDFTIVGTNKKGIGIEDHYISMEKIQKFSSMY